MAKRVVAVGRIGPTPRMFLDGTCNQSHRPLHITFDNSLLPTRKKAH